MLCCVVFRYVENTEATVMRPQQKLAQNKIRLLAGERHQLTVLTSDLQTLVYVSSEDFAFSIYITVKCYFC